MEISDDQLIGFADGSGTFYVGVVPSFETNSGWQIIHFFKLSGGSEILPYLTALKEKIGGYIKENKNGVNYFVRDLKSLTGRLLPFFEGKLVANGVQFNKFKDVINLVSDKKHLRKEGITRVLEIAYSMNTQKRSYSKEGIINAYGD